ncbi:hypothetical protein PVAND_015033 [Polypedilum vanderplanki]|uniref:Endonuclease/exonuclease/phosphatase domain-containing protein n=1 Tax=Polypedilum vanderplanki TaxID=319348 RepID=A0A9J6BBU3_POLVA|nr:hypothetical protein PVAND_015033 [Polypedilum vanderplanki]
MLFKSHYTTHNRFENITIIVSDQIFMNSHIVTLQECWAVDNESYNIPDFEEISRNRLIGRPRAFGTINFCKLNIEPAYQIESKLKKATRIITLELLKETLLEVKDYIDESENILILGDFNHELKLGNQLESFMLGTFGTSLFSRRESTTNTRTVIEEYSVELKTIIEVFYL